MIAALRLDSWDFPLFVHVLGAMALFGGVGAILLLSLAGQRMPEQAVFARRTAFVTLLAVVWPAYVVMRVGAQWIFDKEDLDPDMPTWISTGIVVGDGGALVLIALTVLGWLALRRKPSVARYFAGLAGVYLVALVVAWWAMTAKPGA
ncbi:MAG TPA: hypothetical protein VF232_04545 [Gaiellaceae bacterium]